MTWRELSLLSCLIFAKQRANRLGRSNPSFKWMLAQIIDTFGPQSKKDVSFLYDFSEYQIERLEALIQAKQQRLEDLENGRKLEVVAR